MITLTFQHNSLEEDRCDNSINQEDDAVLEVTGFKLPVMFLVNNINLLEITREEVVMVYNTETGSLVPEVTSVTSPWLWIPVLNFALIGLKTTRQIYLGRSSYFAIPDNGSWISFEVKETEVKVYSGVNKKSVSTNALELLLAFEKFRNEVRDFLSAEMPCLRKSRYWRSWFEEE